MLSVFPVRLAISIGRKDDKIVKRATKAALLSILFMGLGQQYNKERIKGVIFSLIQIVTLINIPHFRQALWGLITLGETPRQIVGLVVVPGDHSLFLLIKGIIMMLVAFVILIIYVLNVADAYSAAISIEGGEQSKTFVQSLKSVWSTYFPYIVLTPAFLFLLFFTVLPLIFSIAIAFTNYSGPHHLPPGSLVDWVGFTNFINLLDLGVWGGTFLGVGAWTVVWAILASATTYAGGLLLAVLINSKGVRFKKLWRGIFVLPWAVPGFLSLLIMRLLFTGLGPINCFLLDYLGFAERVPWLTDPVLARVVIVAVNLWLGAPFFMVLMSGILTNISEELYEAASIDGASEGQKFWKITLPLVVHATIPLLILSFTFNFNNFILIYVFTGGGPANPAYRFAGHTDILISWIFTLTLEQMQFHMASVISIVLFIIIASVSALAFSKTKSFQEENLAQ